MDESQVRRALTFGPLIAAAGIVWTAVAGAKNDSTLLPSLVVLGGVGLCIWGTHFFGRLGPAPSPFPPPAVEEAAELAPAREPKTRKKKRSSAGP
ncbi:MAG: hypothetical protein JNL79_30615 [Myxococcales bacterium]|nr:hypothetical protein [Myxococcales bacterium]